MGRLWNRIALATATVGVSLWSPATAQRATDHSSIAQQTPNILVLVADDAGWQDFGAYGSPAAKTPHLDALANAGVTFERAILTTPQCSPSRISILTGKYPHQTGAEDLHTPLPDGQRFVTSYLSPEGYLTGHLRKAHYGPNGNAQFDWYSEDLADFSAFLDTAGERPFFLWVGFVDPHRPYRNDAIVHRHDPNDVVVPGHLDDTPETRADLADYLDEIARMDSVIGTYMSELDRRGLRERTVVVFLSDNGAPFPRAKGSLYDAGIRTPLIVSWPQITDAGKRSTSLVSAIDLAPTFLDLAGISVPDDLEGVSLLTALRGDSTAGRVYAFSERNWHNCDEHMRSVTTDRYKLIRNAYLDVPHGTAADITSSPSWKALHVRKKAGTLTSEQSLLFTVPRPEYELYDLSVDPSEYRNLAYDPAYRETFEELSAVLEAWRVETDDFPPDRRRRGDNTDRYTGIKFTNDIPPQVP